MDDHPVRFTVEDDLRRSRLTVFYRLPLAIPLIIWLAVWSIAVFFAVIATWFATLVRGSAPRGLHDFLAAYVCYGTHVGAYFALAANPYPVDGPYPVDVEIAGPQPQARWKVALRLFLVLPALLLGAVVGWGVDYGGFRVVTACALLGWFASLALGRMPNGLRDLAAYGLGYGAQVSAYGLLLTDRYPNSDPNELGPAWSLPPHPVWLELDDDGRRSRLTVVFRLLLSLPHLVWLALWSVAAVLAVIANWFVALFRGQSAEPLHRFLAAYIQYSVHVTAFLFIVANPFPGFTGGSGYPVGVGIAPAERQSRWITLFRLFLSLPAFVLAGALAAVIVAVGILGWFAALATGRMPTGLRNLGAISIRYQAQTHVYSLILNDRYPYASPALPPIPEPEPEPEYEAYVPPPEPEAAA